MSGESLKIYIAGAYSGKTEKDIETNVNLAIDAGIVIFQFGHFPYIPHLTHWVDKRATNPFGVPFLIWKDYMIWDSVWVDSCDALYLLSHSKGADIELLRAIETNKQIFYFLSEIPKVERKKTWVEAKI